MTVELTSAISCRYWLSGKSIPMPVRSSFGRSSERSLIAEALNDSATDAQRSEVHVLGSRIAFLDESDVGAEIDVPGRRPSTAATTPIIESASAASAFEAGVKLPRRRNLEQRNEREPERILRVGQSNLAADPHVADMVIGATRQERREGIIIRPDTGRDRRQNAAYGRAQARVNGGVVSARTRDERASVRAGAWA